MDNSTDTLDRLAAMLHEETLDGANRRFSFVTTLVLTFVFGYLFGSKAPAVHYVYSFALTWLVNILFGFCLRLFLRRD